MAKELEKLYDNPFDDQNLVGMENAEFEGEVNNLIEWCEDLDYVKLFPWSRAIPSAVISC